MGQQPVENDPPQGHPAWQEILNGVPEDLHPLLRNKLEAWDRGVEAKLQGVRQEYEAYQPLVENEVPFEAVQQALWLAQQLEQNPDAVVQQAIDAFGLDYVAKAAAAAADEDDNDMPFGDDFEGLEDHPAFKEMQQKADEAHQAIQAQREQEQEAEALAELEDYLETLHNDPQYGDFDDLYVTALMAQGVDGEDAIKQYQTTIQAAVEKATNGQVRATTQTPVVMGGEGNSGSGIPNEVPNFAGMNRGSVNDLVQQYLANNSGQ